MVPIWAEGPCFFASFSTKKKGLSVYPSTIGPITSKFAAKVRDRALVL